MADSGARFLEKYGSTSEWSRHLVCDLGGGSKQVLNHVVTLPEAFQDVTRVGVALNTDPAFAKDRVARAAPGIYVFLSTPKV